MTIFMLNFVSFSDSYNPLRIRFFPRILHKTLRYPRLFFNGCSSLLSSRILWYSMVLRPFRHFVYTRLQICFSYEPMIPYLHLWLSGRIPQQRHECIQRSSLRSSTHAGAFESHFSFLEADTTAAAAAVVGITDHLRIPTIYSFERA